MNGSMEIGGLERTWCSGLAIVALSASDLVYVQHIRR